MPETNRKQIAHKSSEPARVKSNQQDARASSDPFTAGDSRETTFSSGRCRPRPCSHRLLHGRGIRKRHRRGPCHQCRRHNRGHHARAGHLRQRCARCRARRRRLCGDCRRNLHVALGCKSKSANPIRLCGEQSTFRVHLERPKDAPGLETDLKNALTRAQQREAALKAALAREQAERDFYFMNRMMWAPMMMPPPPPPPPPPPRPPRR